MQASKTPLQPSAHRPLLLALLVAVNLMWGSIWPISKIALREMSPLQLGGWRAVLAGVVLLPALGRELRRGNLPLGALPAMVMLGFLAFVGSKALGYWGVNLSTGLNASLLTSVEPLLTMLLARIWLGELLTGRKIWGLAFGGTGAYLLIAGGFRLPDFSALGVLGDMIFLGGLGMEALYSVWGKTILKRHSPLIITSVTLVAAAVMWIPVLLVDGTTNGWPVPSGVGIAAVIYMALGCTVFAYFAWLYVLSHMEVGLAGMSILLQPLSGALLSVLLLRERLQPAATLGGALIILSLLIVSRKSPEGPAQ